MTQAVELKTKSEIAKMRESGKLLNQVFNELSPHIVPGVSTAELDQVARKCIEDGGARPAFLGYHGFPATLCTSVNSEIVHGIPNKKPLKEGDVVSLDCGLVLGGFYSDHAITFPVGEISSEAKRLLQITEESLYEGIKCMYPDARIGTVSAAIQKHIEDAGFSVVRDYTGHGIGRAMHEPPQVLNYGKADTGFRLRTGLVLAIEPMVNLGTWKTETLDDGWTVVTADGSLSAHFEHTVAVTDDGPVILTE